MSSAAQQSTMVKKAIVNSIDMQYVQRHFCAVTFKIIFHQKLLPGCQIKLLLVTLTELNIIVLCNFYQHIFYLAAKITSLRQI